MSEIARMWSACQASYEAIPSSGDTSELPGFLGPVTRIVAGGGIDACLVGQTAENEATIAFRGTLSIADTPTLESVKDWINDFNAVLVTWTMGSSTPGRVHLGFLTTLLNLWEPLKAAVLKLATKCDKIMVTGHSKGGGVAPLAAAAFLTHGVKADVVTFAAPRAVDSSWAEAYNLQISHKRFEAGSDVVPHVPPVKEFVKFLRYIPLVGNKLGALPITDYAEVGELYYLPAGAKNALIVGDSPQLKAGRFLELVRFLVTEAPHSIGLQHSLDVGYERASKL